MELMLRKLAFSKSVPPQGGCLVYPIIRLWYCYASAGWENKIRSPFEAFMTHKSSFQPIVRNDAQLLILGSLPGDASIIANRYYAHPRNQFWQLMQLVTNAPLVAISYADRIAALTNAGVGLWDVVATARRHGSLDSDLRVQTLNDLPRVVDQLVSLRAVAFNGSKAAALGRPLIKDRAHLTLIDLPSSSAAFTRALDTKFVTWRQLAKFCYHVDQP
jgi:double-stranded uracil-DNA glycosylase